MWLASSADGVHWKSEGPVLKDGHAVYKMYIYETENGLAMNCGSSSQSERKDNDTIRYYCTSDMKHWEFYAEDHPDGRWYHTNGRWDHMYVYRDQDGTYYGYPVATPLPEQRSAWGLRKSTDGLHWETLEPPVIDWGDLPRINCLEVGGMEKIGDKYYFIGGYVGYAGNYGYSLYTFTADHPAGPFVPDKEAFRLESQLEKYQEQRDNLINYLWNEYELTPVTARELRKDGEEFASPSQIRAKTHELKTAIKELGNVNVGAIEEYKEVFERYSFLKTQHDDLILAKESLEQIIAELDEGMRRQFSQKFGEIKTEFDKVFKELFGGGQGTLSLIEGEDILTAGVQIIAQPPGKKLQNMMQLSGGEKALTAISLLFAIQNLKPSPFCLLDEIEAALDDSNVDRFANYLGKLTDHTQFILITHRRGTMLRADRLYGITMQEKGVSTLVSVNLTDAEGGEA
jgi:hypothetical protein